MLKVIVIGAESSGKTTLCNALAEHFNIPFIAEFAREFLNKLDGNYTQDNLLVIAKGQLQSEQLTTNTNQLSLQDTDLITIKIWSEYKYGNCDNWILEQIEKQKKEIRFYLLCKPDIPWEADPLRENPNNRDKLFEIYKKDLENLGHDYYVVEGKRRLEKVIEKIYQLTTPN
jgi:NadR type nicotinamide-nucleotide adenylyltransferase